jgi:putative ABC transport system permease protein
VRVALPPGTGKMTGEERFAQQESTFHQMTERIAALPGAKSADAISNFLIRGDTDESITIEGRPPLPDGQGTGQLASQAVSPGFFQTMGVPLLRGRFLSRADALKAVYLMFDRRNSRENTAAVVVNDTFARHFLPNEDPVGKRFYIGQLTGKHYWYEIAGVVGDMRREVLEKQPIPEYFVPLISNTADLVVRTDGDPLTLAGAVRQSVRSIEKNAMILGISTVESLYANLSATRRLQTWLLGVFAALALALSGVGIYGIMHYAVAQRTHEIGVRVALGAQSSDVVRLVIGQGMKQAAAGLLIGLLAAWGLAGVMAHMLFEVSEHDPVTFVGVGLGLAAVAFVACWLPARRATRVDPVTALRCE